MEAEANSLCFSVKCWRRQITASEPDAVVQCSDSSVDSTVSRLHSLTDKYLLGMHGNGMFVLSAIG